MEYEVVQKKINRLIILKESISSLVLKLLRDHDK